MSLIGTNVLIVEDNDFQYHDIQKVLFDHQPDGMIIRYILQRAETLEQALKYTSINYDLILLDLNLPDSTGFKTFETIKNIVDAKYHEIPIIVTTILEDITTGLECYKAGAAGYVVKSWIASNPLLLHVAILSSIEINRQALKLRNFMAERVGKHQPLLQRCKACITRIGYSRWKTESHGIWLLPDEYIEAAGLHFTDGVCPECFDIIYKPQLDQP